MPQTNQKRREEVNMSQKYLRNITRLHNFHDLSWSWIVNVQKIILDAVWNCVNGWICLKFPRETLRPQKRKSFKFLHSNFSFTQSAFAFQTASLDQNYFASNLGKASKKSQFRLTVRGGVTPPGLTVSICKKHPIFSFIKW